MPLVQIGKRRGYEFSLNYNLYGNGDIKVLFIMGLGASHIGWMRQIEYFESQGGYTVCAFDNRGTGLSEVVPGKLASTLEMARDASELLDHLGWERNVHLVGISMGGMISQELTLQRPETFSSVVLTCTHSGGTVVPMKGMLGVPKGFFLTTPVDKISNLSEVLFPEEYLLEPAPRDFCPTHIPQKGQYSMKDVFIDNFLRGTKNTKPTSPQGFLLQLGGVLTHYVSSSRLQILKDSHIDFLVTTGSDDCLVKPSNSKYLSEQLDAPLVVFKGIGHGINEQIPEEYNRLIKDHINNSISKSHPVSLPFS